jgi:hypothetical protein
LADSLPKGNSEEPLWRSPLKLQITREKDQYAVDFAMSLPGVGQGESTNELSALVRPFRRTLLQGASVGSIAYLFARNQMNDVRVLGTLCYTPGKQVLFFPGLLNRRITCQVIHQKTRYITTGADEYLDHITVDKEGKKWHYTIVNSQNYKRIRLPAEPVRKVAKGLRYWFELHIQDFDELERVPKTLHIREHAPEISRIQRLADVYMDSHYSAMHSWVDLPAKWTDGNGFLNYQFYLDFTGGNPKWEEAGGIQRLDPPVVSEPLVISPPIPQRATFVGLAGYGGLIWVISYGLKGRLTIGAAFTSLGENFRSPGA